MPKRKRNSFIIPSCSKKHPVADPDKEEEERGSKKIKGPICKKNQSIRDKLKKNREAHRETRAEKRQSKQFKAPIRKKNQSIRNKLKKNREAHRETRHLTSSSGNQSNNEEIYLTLQNPLNESIPSLAARRAVARQNHRLYLAQKLKTNDEQSPENAMEVDKDEAEDHEEISTSSHNFNNFPPDIDIENAMKLDGLDSKTEKVKESNVTLQKPSKESISRLATRRQAARQSHRMFLAQTVLANVEEGMEVAMEPDQGECNFIEDFKELSTSEHIFSNVLQDREDLGLEANIEKSLLVDNQRLTKRNGQKKGTSKNSVAGDITSSKYIDVQKHMLGDLNVKCQYCGAVRFSEQKGRSVNSCCHQGQVVIPPLKKYPNKLHDLLSSQSMDGQHFRQRIRAYNSSFAFATFGAHVQDIQKGPPLVKIQGQVYHHATSSLTNASNKVPRNGQIYIYDNIEAASKMRIDLQRPDLNRMLETLLREINPYAQNYKMLRDMTINGEELVLNFVQYAFDDKRRYNIPTTSEVAMVMESKDGSVPGVDLKVFPKLYNHDHESTILKQTSQHADPMTFPILFPHGDLGWSYIMKTKKGKTLSPVQYFSHRLALRPDEDFNPLINAGRLSQQYIINCYVLVERQRLDYIKYNQSRLRSECYQGIVDHVANNPLNGADKVRLGTAVILPATYIGSPRCLQQLYQDSMVICRKIGRPDFFITITCNPKWTEITHALNQYFVKGTTANDIPIIVTDIFMTKVQELIKDLTERHVLGPIANFIYTIEFQKRGLPHAHILAALRSDCKLYQPKDVDKFITAELSDTDSSLRYYQLRHMMHGPHVDGLLCWDSEKKVCSKKFPKEFCEHTDMTGDGFPRYKRKDNTNKAYSYHARPNGKVQYVDNRMVVPHNPYLLKKYDCHLNVEYCSSEMAIKYIHKYIHKGHDRARMELKNEENDEIKKYVDSRYVGPMEAAWRLNELPLHNRSHSVVRLPVHLDGQQYITFEEGREELALNRDCKTMLLGWFQLNQQDPSARKILYCNVPDSYCWNAKEKKWTRRKRNAKVVGRVVSVSPRDSERFHLKLILNRVPGAMSYQDLQTHEGVLYTTFREAAIAMGITECSDESIAVLEEAAKTLMPHQMRKFFVYYLIGDEPSDACQLWERFQLEMIDFGSTSNKALCDIELMLNSENRTCEDFGLNKPHLPILVTHSPNVVSHFQKCNEIVQKLNPEQLAVYERIIDSVSGASQQNAQCFFIDGPGGTGKTFLYTGIYHKLLTINKKTSCVAWTGIASILLPSGTTSHRFFNLPLQLNEEGICFLKARDKLRLKEVDVVIWDEASMIPRQALEIIDRTLKDVMNNSRPFGGKTFILGGDFRQVLPVVKKASRSQIVYECIKSSYLWEYFEIHHLKVNMRVLDGANQFAEWLLQFGNGEQEELAIDQSFTCSDLSKWFFDGVEDMSQDLVHRIILSPQNDEVFRINDQILSQLPGEEKVSFSIDKATLSGIDKSHARDEEATLRYSDEYLHSLTPPGLPPHKLKLKVGCIVMLIRNLCMADGLCNGTRLLVLKIQCRVLTLKIITGDKKGTVVDIPRIQLNTSDNSQMPFILYRRQFPVRLAFALTINKSQGQTFQHVGIFIHRPIFAHGQLYVALSRCVAKQNIKVFVKEGNVIKNIVYKEVL